MKKLFKQLDTKLKIIGSEEGDLGYHSYRKGVDTMVDSGYIAPPPIITLCIWVGWVLGWVKDKYLFWDKSGDQYDGRCASFLDQLKNEFAFSQPYFYFTEL